MKREDLIGLTEEERKEYHQRLIYVIFILTIFLAGGTLFYHHFEGWRYLDSLYFSAVTITTVGYGDKTPSTDIGKLFTIFYVFAGVATALYGLTLIAAHLIERREELWLKRLEHARLKEHTQNFLGKLKDVFVFDSKRLIGEHPQSGMEKKKKH